MLTINTKTKELAQQFMPRRHEIKARIGLHVFSIQEYDENHNPQSPHAEFDKWVGVEVSNFEGIPNGMDTLILKGGTYAVFKFKGAMQDFPKSRAFIFNEWLPKSEYQLAPKAHFEILSENYSKDLNNIEEEIWIPVQ
jgi:AraC family transcriptional regulator